MQKESNADSVDELEVESNEADDEVTEVTEAAPAVEKSDAVM